MTPGSDGKGKGISDVADAIRTNRDGIATDEVDASDVRTLWVESDEHQEGTKFGSVQSTR